MGQLCTEFPIVHKIKLVVLSPGYDTKISYLKRTHFFIFILVVMQEAYLIIVLQADYLE